MIKRANVIVSGTVQGVNFRWYAKRKALALGITGWVRNTPDGKVECEFQGSEENVDQMIEIIKSGPPSASVDDVQIKWFDEDPDLIFFQVRTA